MKKKVTIIPLFVVALATAVLFTQCQPPVQKHANKISVSIAPLKYLVDEISGNSLEVNVLLPPGASPATYEPTARQVQQMNQSAVYFQIGYLGFELSWMDRFKAAAPELKFYNLSKGMELIRGKEKHGDHFHVGGIDPHTWSSPRYFLKMAFQISQVLGQQFPEKKTEFQKNYQHLKEKLQQLDNQCHQQLTQSGVNSFMIYHPALSYLARDYQLEQIAIEVDGKTPSAAHLKQFIDLAREKNISTIFIQKQFDEENAKTLASEVNATTVRINPLGENYPAEMQKIIQALTQSVR